MSADFFCLAVPIDDARGAKLEKQFLKRETKYNGNVYVDIDFDEAAELMRDDGDFPMSPNFPIFVAIDQFAAIPAGVDFLSGHAVKHVASKSLKAFEENWKTLLTGVGGASGLATKIAPQLDRWGNGKDDVKSGARAIESAISAARQARSGLFVLCFPA